MNKAVIDEKTKYIRMGADITNVFGTFNCKNKSHSFEEVQQFDYFGVTITNKSEGEVEIDNTRSCKAAGSMPNTLRSRKPKIHMYKTRIRPAVLYGCEIWVINTQMETKLDVWE